MNDAPIQIRNPEIVRAIRELAAETGRPITEVVGDVVQAELARRQARLNETYDQRLVAIREISRQFRDLPVVGPTPTDDDFYDEDGFPK
jgi:hypothetical protein